MGTRLFDQASISGADALDFIANILESSTEYSIESDIVALMTTDPLRVITDIDEQMVALTGSQRDELVGSPFKDYFTDPAQAEEGAEFVGGRPIEAANLLRGIACLIERGGPWRRSSSLTTTARIVSCCGHC